MIFGIKEKSIILNNVLLAIATNISETHIYIEREIVKGQQGTFSLCYYGLWTHILARRDD